MVAVSKPMPGALVDDRRVALETRPCQISQPTTATDNTFATPDNTCPLPDNIVHNIARPGWVSFPGTHPQERS